MRTIGILIVALFLALATCGDALASGGHRGGHKPESVTKDGDGKNKNDKKQTKKKKRTKRRHHHRQGSPP